MDRAIRGLGRGPGLEWLGPSAHEVDELLTPRPARPPLDPPGRYPPSTCPPGPPAVPSPRDVLLRHRQAVSRRRLLLSMQSRSLELHGTPEARRRLKEYGRQTLEFRVSGTLLTAKQVGKLLGVPTSWVYEQSRRGRIPTVTL